MPAQSALCAGPVIWLRTVKPRLVPRTIPGLVFAMALVSGVISVLVAGAMIYVVHREMERQLDQTIEVETNALLDFYKDHDFTALAHVVAVRDQRALAMGNVGYLAGMNEDGRAIAHILVDAEGKRRAGTFAADLPPPGWSEFVRFRRGDGTMGVAQAMNSPLTGGGSLVVAADRAVIDQMDWKMLQLFALGYGVLLVLGVVVSLGFGRAIQSRLAGIETSAKAIMAGDLSRRMPLDGSGSEFDRLSLVLNRMLDRMGALRDNLRQVSGDIAHDLRTPLQRVRNKLERAAISAEGTPTQDQLHHAIAEIGGLLDLFSSLLAISEIEGQSVRARFVPVDLQQAVEEIIEVYRPTFEDCGRRLDFIGVPTTVRGDRRLLQQVVANLLDNTLLHAGSSTGSHILLEHVGERAVLKVHDNGPGIPPSEHERVFKRLTRVDASRSTPGHGLGLNLVAAIVDVHDGTVGIEPSQEGLTMKIELPLQTGAEHP